MDVLDPFNPWPHLMALNTACSEVLRNSFAKFLYFAQRRKLAEVFEPCG
jgi:hypothetical protein